MFRKVTLLAPPQNPHYSYLITLITLMTAVTLTLGVVTLSVIEQRLLASAGSTLALAAANIAEKLDASLYAEYEDVENTATVMSLMWRDPRAMRHYLEKRKTLNPDLLWTSVADAEGRVITTTNDRITSPEVIETEWYQQGPHTDEIYVRESEVQERAATITTVAFSAPIRSRSGELLGVVTHHMELLPLEAVFAETARVLQMQHETWGRIEWQFLNRHGDVLGDSLLRQEGKINLKLMGLPSALFTGATEPGYVEEMHARRLIPVVSGYAQTQGYKRFTGLHWGILVRLDRGVVLGEIRSILWKLAVAEAVMFLPMLTLLVWSAYQLRHKWILERDERERATAAELTLRHKEAAVRREKEFSERLINSSVDGILAFDRQCRYTLWNRGMECMSGMSASTVMGKCAFDVFPFLTEIGEDEFFRSVLEGNSIVAKDRPYHVPKTGKRGYFEAYYSPLRDEAGNIEGALAIVRDVTVRKVTESALRESEERFRVIFNHAKDAIFLTDTQGVVFWANREAERLADRPLTGLLGRPIGSLFAPQEQASGEPESATLPLPEGTHECAVLRSDGTTVSAETNTASVSFSEGVFGRIVIARDITERIRMEQKLRQADKLAAFGTLLGGVAHELKNPLFIISGNLQLAKTLLSEGENHVIRKNVDAIDEATQRASSIIERFLRVMHSKEHHVQPCQVNEVITSTLELVSHNIATDHIDVQLELTSDLPRLVSDPEGLSQVFLNLFTNACQALISIEGDRILRISTNLILTASGLCVEARVTDNGPGIQHEHLSSIFDPFFTTKPVGQGTGLGLSISHRIMTELGGSLRCESRVGHGATFIAVVGISAAAKNLTGQRERLKEIHGSNPNSR